MRKWLIVAAMLGAGLTASCSRYDVKDIDFTRAQFAAHRPEFEALADKALLCDGPTYIDLRRRHDTRPCTGGKVTRKEIESELKRLKLWSVHWEKNGSSVRLTNGEHYIPSFDVGSMSEMVRYATPQSKGGDFETPLTPAPHYWFYSQHD